MHFHLNSLSNGIILLLLESCISNLMLCIICSIIYVNNYCVLNLFVRG